MTLRRGLLGQFFSSIVSFSLAVSLGVPFASSFIFFAANKEVSHEGEGEETSLKLRAEDVAASGLLQGRVREVVEEVGGYH